MNWFRNTIPVKISHREGAVMGWEPTALISDPRNKELSMRYTPCFDQSDPHYVDFQTRSWLVTGREAIFYNKIAHNWLNKGTKILEIGCGLGALTSILVERGMESLFIDPVNYADLESLMEKVHNYAQTNFSAFILNSDFKQDEYKMKNEQRRFAERLIELSRRCQINKSIINGKHKRAWFLNTRLEEVYPEIAKFQPDVIISAFAHDHWDQGLGWITNLQRYAQGARLITPTSNRIL